jgi:hypothetical protein
LFEIAQRIPRRRAAEIVARAEAEHPRADICDPTIRIRPIQSQRSIAGFRERSRCTLRALTRSWWKRLGSTLIEVAGAKGQVAAGESIAAEETQGRCLLTGAKRDYLWRKETSAPGFGDGRRKSTASVSTGSTSPTQFSGSLQLKIGPAGGIPSDLGMGGS